jgi:hypothetical protein
MIKLIQLVHNSIIIYRDLQNEDIFGGLHFRNIIKYNNYFEKWDAQMKIDVLDKQIVDNDVKGY